MENIALESAVESKPRWVALPLVNGGGVRSSLHVGEHEIVVEKAFGFYYFTVSGANGRIVFDSRYYTDDRRMGWSTPHEARKAAEAWANGK